MDKNHTNVSVWEDRFCKNEKERPQAGYRAEYVRDRARVIHSAGFRRLQAKTQVLGIAEGDFHRTRLTHSLEVAQIARGIVLFLSKSQENEIDEDNLKKWFPGQNLIETISLAHDLGHPPYGHGGEVALNYSMRKYGGFEGNGQTLRLLTKLESHTVGCGLNLTRRSLLGVLKYPVVYEDVVKTKLAVDEVDRVKLKMSDWRPPKCYMSSEQDIVEWILRPFSDEDRYAMLDEKVAPSDHKHGGLSARGLDASIMDLADDIAYAVHDLEDAISLRLIYREQWEHCMDEVDEDWLNRHAGYLSVRSLTNDLFADDAAARKWAIGALVNALIVSTLVQCRRQYKHPLFRYNVQLKSPADAVIKILKGLTRKYVVQRPEVQSLEYRGQQIVLKLFDAFSSDPERLLTDGFKGRCVRDISIDDLMRCVCDFVAGMTDEYANRMYERLFVPRHGQYSDRL